MKSFPVVLLVILTVGRASATVPAPPSLWSFSQSSSGTTAANGEDWLYAIAQTADGGYLAGGYSEVTSNKQRAATFVLLDSNRTWPPVWEKVFDPGTGGEAVIFGVVETPNSWIGVGTYRINGSHGKVLIVTVDKNNPAIVTTQLFTPPSLGLAPTVNAGCYSISRVVDSGGDHGFIVACTAFDATPQHLPNTGFLLGLTPTVALDPLFGSSNGVALVTAGSTANPPRTMCKRARVTHSSSSGQVSGFVVSSSIQNSGTATVSDGFFETFGMHGAVSNSRTLTTANLPGPYDNTASAARPSLCPQALPSLNTSNVNIFDVAETANGDFVGLAQVNFASWFNPSNCSNARLNGFSYVDMTAVLVRVTPSLTPLWAKEAGRFSGIDFEPSLLPMNDGFAVVGNDAGNSANLVNASVIKTNFSGDVVWNGLYLRQNDQNDCMFGAAMTFDNGIVIAGNNDRNDEDYFAMKIGPAADLWVHDIPTDNGDEPDGAGGVMWDSNDIWVRTQQDFYPFPNQHNPQNPEYRDPLLQVPNYVYVAVQNRGTMPATGKVTVYYAKASTGLAWPVDWTGALCCGHPCSGSLAPVPVINLAPGATQIVEAEWYPPNPADFASGSCGLVNQQGHFCLLARIETATIAPWGMTYPEVASVYANTAANNSIAWKNVSIVDNVPGAGLTSYGFVRNIFETPAAISLRFNMTRGARTKTLFDFATVDVTLDAELIRGWKAGGSAGAGVQQIDETTLRVAPGAHIDNIAMQGRQTQRFSVRITPTAGAVPQLPAANFDVIQAESQNGSTAAIVGGMRFLLQPPPIPKRRPAVLPANR
jgi:hypothetical protein